MKQSFFMALKILREYARDLALAQAMIFVLFVAALFAPRLASDMITAGVDAMRKKEQGQ